jgi:hypothetical protein
MTGKQERFPLQWRRFAYVEGTVSVIPTVDNAAATREVMAGRAYETSTLTLFEFGPTDTVRGRLAPPPPRLVTTMVVKEHAVGTCHGHGPCSETQVTRGYVVEYRDTGVTGRQRSASERTRGSSEEICEVYNHKYKQTVRVRERESERGRETDRFNTHDAAVGEEVNASYFEKRRRFSVCARYRR